MLTKEELTILYEKFLQNECNEQELQLLVDAMAAASNDETNFVSQLFDKAWNGKLTDAEENQPATPLTILEITRSETLQMKCGKNWIPRWMGAACAALLLGLGMFMWFKRSKAPVLSDEAAQIQLSPENNKATLLLADGSAISLSNGNDTTLAMQGNVQLLQKNNSIVYKTNSNDGPASMYNVLTTPPGGQYKLTLPDGSRAWLNAATSIRFPVCFTGATRQVEVSGEVYFEIQKNATQSFVVHAGLSRTEVLGTHFDVKAYTDEPSVNVTLIKGSVRFNSARFQQVLAVGEQAQFDKKSQTGSVQEADFANAMAWTRGEFPLNSPDLESLMREISRWYDVDLEIKTKLPNRQFQGTLKRNISLSSVLAALNANGVDAKLEGRKLIVSMK